MPHVRTATLGVWVGSGSRYEGDEVQGISHFLEHLFFKGTHGRTALDIAQAVDSLGGLMNAFTDKEHTCFYVKVLANHLPAIVELLADMLQNSALDAGAIERERQVITEEISMYEDSPDELVQDLIAQTIWNGHPLGRPVIGTRASVSRMRREDFVGHIGTQYRADNLVVAAAGDVDHALVEEVVARHFGGLDGRIGARPTEVPVPEPAISVRSKEIEQVHLCLATRGKAQADECRYQLAILDHLLGGGMSSRLFQEIREKRGLVYTIASYTASYREGGMFVIYAAMSPQNGPEVIRLVFEEIGALGAGLSEEELCRAKESLKGSIMLSLESTGSRMSKLARSELYHGRQLDLDELIGKIDAVTSEEVRGLVWETFGPGRVAMAAIGPFDGNRASREALEGALCRSTDLLDPAGLHR